MIEEIKPLVEEAKELRKELEELNTKVVSDLVDIDDDTVWNRIDKLEHNLKTIGFNIEEIFNELAGPADYYVSVDTF